MSERLKSASEQDTERERGGGGRNQQVIRKDDAERKKVEKVEQESEIEREKDDYRVNE